MGTCLVECALVPSISFCQTDHPVTQSLSLSSSSDIMTNSNQSYDQFLQTSDSMKKRSFNRSYTYHSYNETTMSMTKMRTSDSCLFQADPSYNNDSISSISNRPNTLLLSPPSEHLSIPPILRTFLSHPGTLTTPLILLDNNSIGPLEFTSVTDDPSPPLKRLRSQTSVHVTTTNISVNIEQPPSAAVLPTSSTVELVNPSELAEKLQGNFVTLIFDCGSPFRHSESRIQNSILLPVADKISRRRFKTIAKKDGLLNGKQLYQTHLIILYDDSINQHRSSTDNDLQLSVGIKFACDEIQSTLSERYPPIFILNCPFNQFFDLYPNLCESIQPHSSPSSPTQCFYNDSSLTRQVPFTAPILPSTISDHDLLVHPMTYISHGIYIGSENDAKNFDGLKAERIEHIVNVTTHVPLYHSEQMQYCHIPADDTQKQNLLNHFDQAHTFIQQAIENNHRVLVHCVAGISRSPVIVISFLMRYAQMSMNDAYDLVRRKRAIIAPNLNFMGQLLQYERKLREEK